MIKEQLLQSWWLIAISITAGVAGQTSIKLGLSGSSGSAPIAGPFSVITLILTSPLVLLGLTLYGLGSLTWIAVLSRLNLSYAYPFLALNFVLIALISWLVLGEAIPMTRWLGIGCICAGILFVAQGAY
ncbi:MAG: EamA family transporter [Caldilineaceae bacterium]|nr:EamA family transporter [Caldilineaceae bacterium]